MTNRHIYSLLFVLSVFAIPSVALAHVHLEKSIPAKDEQLTTLPTTVQLWFSGNVEAEWSKIEVKDANGQRVDQGKVSAIADSPKAIQIDLKSTISGTYEVKWNAVASDGHRIKGSFTFHLK